MPKFRKKPVVIEAVQWQAGKDVDGVVSPEIDSFDDERGSTQFEPFIRTLEGDHIVRPGDWVVTGVKGEKYNVKDEIFRATYDPVDQEAKDVFEVETNPFEKLEPKPHFLDAPKYFVFDIKSVGFHGIGFAFGYVVIDHLGRELEAGFYQCDPESVVGGTKEDRDWIKENVLPHLPNSGYLSDTLELRSAFWDIWTTHQSSGASLVADCLWPVEARFLNACIDDDFINRKKSGPYPVHELATALLLAGMDPIGEYERLPNELPKHHPTCDARQSARLFWEAMQVIRGTQLSQALKEI